MLPRDWIRSVVESAQNRLSEGLFPKPSFVSRGDAPYNGL